MLVGYARVSTADQNPQLQLDALMAAGCGKVFVEKASGAKINRAELTAALEYMRPGDTLTVWKLDRLARSMKQLITTVEDLKAQGIGFRSLTEVIDTTNAAGELFFHILACAAERNRKPA
jgi:DNA invertase Pin-like site-specific DNA recombinase